MGAFYKLHPAVIPAPLDILDPLIHVLKNQKKIKLRYYKQKEQVKKTVYYTIRRKLVLNAAIDTTFRMECAKKFKMNAKYTLQRVDATNALMDII